MDTLGTRIRTFRKQRKLTLEQCAGEQMTKGMLSLIENDKANPSMESLNYLAEKLELSVSELLDDIHESELRTMLDEAEHNYKTNDKTSFMKATELIEPLIPKLNRGYEAARLLEVYGRMSAYLKRQNWQSAMEKASALYIELNLLPRLAAVGLFRSIHLFKQQQYEEALAYLLEQRAELRGKSGYIDPLTHLDLETYEAIFRFAVNDVKEATGVMNAAITYSKKHLIFHQTGQLYRLAAFRAVIDEDEDKLDYYEQKLLQYGEFTEDEQEIWFIKLIRIHQLNSFRKDYKTALKQLNDLPYPPKDEALILNFYLLERGKALYGTGWFEEALESLSQVIISEHLHHPFDLSIYYEKDAYAALCSAELGDFSNAKKLAAVAAANMKKIPDNPYKKFIEETEVDLLHKED